MSAKIEIQFIHGKHAGEHRWVSPDTARELVDLGWAEIVLPTPVTATTRPPNRAVLPRPQPRD